MDLVDIIKFLIFVTVCEGMTMKQIKNTGKMMRKSCQPKNNVEDGQIGNHKLFNNKQHGSLRWSALALKNRDKIDDLNKGIFHEDREVKCYIACIMKMANAHKNGKVSYEASMKQADLVLPEDIKGPAKESITACKKAADGQKDICEASFMMTKCVYNYNPSIFFFP